MQKDTNNKSWKEGGELTKEEQEEFDEFCKQRDIIIKYIEELEHQSMKAEYSELRDLNLKCDKIIFFLKNQLLKNSNSKTSIDEVIKLATEIYLEKGLLIVVNCKELIENKIKYYESQKNENLKDRFSIHDNLVERAETNKVQNKTLTKIGIIKPKTLDNYKIKLSIISHQIEKAWINEAIKTEEMLKKLYLVARKEYSKERKIHLSQLNRELAQVNAWNEIKGIITKRYGQFV